MKRFSSYGPPDPETEFMVQRPALVQQVVDRLVGDPKKGGHYFTVFAPRQVGKTTTLRQAVARLRETLGDSFHVGMVTLHTVKDFRKAIPRIFKVAFGMKVKAPKEWEDVQTIFSRGGPLKKPAILILDEFDGIPGPELAETVAMFRQLYLEREETRLHGLALIGVHAVLGELTSTMSPFNVQRSLNIPNLTRDEVISLYAQYTAESGQVITPEGVERIYEMFRGQPGLTCWFGELLTEKYNPVQPPPWTRREGPPPKGYPPITRAQVEGVITRAQFSEININIRNLISKGMQHQDLLRELFVSHELLFDMNESSIQWLYLNGVLVGEPYSEAVSSDAESSDAESSEPESAEPESSEEVKQEFCAFASPFVQRCLFSAFGKNLQRAYSKALMYETDEPLALGNAVRNLDVPGLVALYRKFLSRQQAKGDPPWGDQPSRTDARPFEAIGHFNLYAWLYGVAKGGISIVPEFPTGNGTADLLLKSRARGREEVLEIKSFTNTSDLEKAVLQAARYARKLKLLRSYLVVMTDPSGYALLRTAPTQHEALGITVMLEVIPWGFWPEGRPQSTGAESSALVTHEGAALAPPASQPTKVSSPVLSIRDRVALETLIRPLLTEENALQLWLQLDHDLSELKTAVPALIFSQLIQRSAAEGRLGSLFLLLALSFPVLETHPLLARLQGEYPA